MDISLLTLDLEIFAIILAWTAFRHDRKEKRDSAKKEKEDILKSVNEELVLMGSWLGTSYDKSSLKGKTSHPFWMVYSLSQNEAIKNSISGRSISLLSSRLSTSLVKFNQLLSNFDQHIQRTIFFNSSNPVLATKAFYLHDKVPEKKRWNYIQNLYKKLSCGKKLLPEELYLIGVNRMMEDLHVIGIGNSNNPDSLHTSYVELINIVNNEYQNLDSEKQFKEPIWFHFVDCVFIFLLGFGTTVLISMFGWKGGVINMNINSFGDVVRILSEITLILIAFWGWKKDQELTKLKILFGVVRGWSKQVQSASNSNSIILDKVRKRVIKKPAELEAALDSQGAYLNGLHVSFQEELELADKVLGAKW